MFTVLPFHLTSAPLIVTETMTVLVKHWRENNVKICSFLDDGAGIEVAFHEAIASSEIL